jgi:hypothetical protein
MSMSFPLRVIPRSLFSWSFSLREGDVEVADLAMALMRERGKLVLTNGSEYNLYRQGWLSGPFLLEGDGAIIAQAEKPNPFTRRFEATIGRRRLCLAAQSPLTRAFGVYDDDIPIGGVWPDHCFTRRTTIDLPDDMPLPVKSFLFWLAVLMWRRAAHNNS